MSAPRKGTEEHRRAMYEAVAKGWMEVVGEKDGKPIFALTEAGIQAVEEMKNDDQD